MRPRIDGPTRPATSRSSHAGFTLLEMFLVAALIVTLFAIAVPIYSTAMAAARFTKAKADITRMSLILDGVYSETGKYPDSLADVGLGTLLDPWGRPYEYFKIEGSTTKGKERKDKNLVPINSDYDLYSMGPDGDSAVPLTAKASRDDIVRGNNGSFIGLAADY